MGELHTASNGEEFWNLLVLQAGLDVLGHDAILAANVATRLGRSAKDLPGCLQPVSAGEVLRAFLGEAESFVAMWTDLLALYEAAGATQGLSNLEIAYDFGADQPVLDFDLESFRRWVVVAREMVARHWLTDDALAHIHNLQVFPSRGLSSVDDEDEVEQTEIQRMTAVLPMERWPDRLPRRPVFSQARFDELAKEAWDLADRYLCALRTISTGHDDRPEWDDTIAFDGASVTGIWQPEVDYWLGFFLQWYEEAHRADLTIGESVDWEFSASALDAALEPFRNSDDRRTEIREGLESFLDLPIWKHRYDLYSNWVCTQVIRALALDQPRVHAIDGRIDFRFSGTHLATFDGFSPRLHLWTELRSPLTAPVGKRKANVQPDMVLRLDPLTSDVVPLAIECKHYRKPANASFANALTDYARAHPQAEVVLVDHGPVNEATVKKKVGADVVGRTQVVADLRPGNDAALSRFAVDVCEATRSLPRSPVKSTKLEPNALLRRSPSTIALKWLAPPIDLDLYVTVPGALAGTAVCWTNLGSADGPPFCTLDKDIVDGSAPEVATVHRWLPGDYVVHVSIYGADRPVRIDAEVEVTIDGRAVSIPWPTGHAASPWHVCTINGATGSITVASS